LSLVSDDKAFSGSFVSQVIGESGLKNLSKVQLEKQLAGKRAGVSVSFSESYEYINGNSTPKDFETLMQLTYLQFTDVNFDKAVFDSFIIKQKKFLPNLLANPEIYFSDQVNKILSQNHPRVFGFPSVEELDKISFEDVKTIYKDRFNDASDFTFIFVGNFENEKIKPVILKYLGSLPNKKRTENWKDLGIRPPKGKLEKVIRRGVDDKSLVQITFTGETKFDLADHRLLSALGELLTIKLVEMLREEKSGVYGVSAGGGMSKIPYERFNFNISFPCGPENVDALTKAALDEVKKIQEGKIEEKDLDKVKESRLVKAREDLRKNEYWGTEISRSLLQNMELSSLSDIENRLKSIKKEDIQRVAQKYLITNQSIQIVLMPESDKIK
jgi:zinc protease